MVQSAFWFAVMSLMVKFASRSLPTMEIVFARGVVALVLASAMLAHARKSPLGGRLGLLLLRGAIGSTALVCYFGAVAHLPLAEAAVIHQTAPLFTALLAAWGAARTARTARRGGAGRRLRGRAADRAS